MYNGEDLVLYNIEKTAHITYGHRSQRTEDPVRSPVLKLRTGRLVLRWVTTWEYRLLYVLQFFFNHVYKLFLIVSNHSEEILRFVLVVRHSAVGC